MWAKLRYRALQRFGHCYICRAPCDGGHSFASAPLILWALAAHFPAVAGPYGAAHLDGLLSALLRAEYRNILVLWAGTNDCAVGPIDCVQPVYGNLAAMARIGHAAGWRVVVVTVIARANYFSDEAHQRQFAANRDALNEVLRHSTEFDGVADPAVILDDGGNGAYYFATYSRVGISS